MIPYENWSDTEKVLGKPMYYVSEITGNKYPYDDYINHGWGGIKYTYKDLPLDEYPYSVESKYEENPIVGSGGGDYDVERKLLPDPFKSIKADESRGIKENVVMSWFYVKVPKKDLVEPDIFAIFGL